MNASAWTCIGTLASTLLYTAPVLAKIRPPQCDSGARAEAFKRGVGIGREDASRLWTHSKEDCWRIEEFESVVAVVADHTLPDHLHPNLACLLEGHRTGMLAETDNLYEFCHDACKIEGMLCGELQAVWYCELSMALGGLTPIDPTEPSDGFCATLFQNECTRMFAAVTYEYEAPEWDDPSTEINEGLCLTYTDQGDDPNWAEVWESVRTYGCAGAGLQF